MCMFVRVCACLCVFVRVCACVYVAVHMGAIWLSRYWEHTNEGSNTVHYNYNAGQ